jgi:acetyltransferase-like isoleucine patch superfamily enzyme
VRKDHRPFILKYISGRLNAWYVQRFIRPHFDHLGVSPMVVQPRTCAVHGKHIRAGDYLHLISHAAKPVLLTTWSSKQSTGKIEIGNYCLIAPGVEITSAVGIQIGDNCMIAQECILSDCDWHGTYNRTRPFHCSGAIKLEENVWLGARVIICKGVTIGANSIIGAGAVVTKDIPANVIAAGNPARVVKHINPKRRMLKREFLFRQGDFYWQNQRLLDEYLTAGNTFSSWLRTVMAPTQLD